MLIAGPGEPPKLRNDSTQTAPTPLPFSPSITFRFLRWDDDAKLGDSSKQCSAKVTYGIFAFLTTHPGLDTHHQPMSGTSTMKEAR